MHEEKVCDFKGLPILTLFTYYLDNLDLGNTIEVERDLVRWFKVSKNKILKLELRRIWFRLIDKDIEGAKEMLYELMESFYQTRRKLRTKNSISNIKYLELRKKLWGF